MNGFNKFYGQIIKENKYNSEFLSFLLYIKGRLVLLSSDEEEKKKAKTLFKLSSLYNPALGKDYLSYISAN